MKGATALFAANRQDWETPKDLFDALNAEFHFTVDVCANEQNRKVRKFWTEEQDGLKQPWDSEVVWCNPPYGRSVEQWVKKAAERSAKIAVLLLPARTDTRWFHEYIYQKAEVRFLKGRVRFVGAKYNAPFPCMIVIFKRQEEE